MPKLPRVSGVEAVRAFQRLGFEIARQKGQPYRHASRDFGLRSAPCEGANSTPTARIFDKHLEVQVDLAVFIVDITSAK